MLGSNQFGDPEIQQLGMAFGRDQNIAGLQIAMDYQVSMGILHSRADVAEKLESLGDGALVAFAIAVDANSFHVFDHKVRKSVRRGSAVDQSRDVGMAQAREYLAFH